VTDGLVLGDQELPFTLPKNLPELRTYLQGALEIEHLTIPPYLTAMYTIQAGTNKAAYYAIRSVVLEEMLHMTLVANLLNALGGRPRVAHPDFVRSYPARLPYSALTVEIPLRHFSPEAMRTFLLIEHPRRLDHGPHDTPDMPPTGPEIDVRWENAYRIDPNASIADYTRYDDTAVYEHAVSFNNAYAELLAHLEIAFNGMPRFMILGVPAMLRLRDLAERLYHNPHPDPDKAQHGYFASATFEIDQHHIERGHQVAAALARTANLNAEEPVDLFTVEP
jgi:Ferritin-like